MIVLNWACKQTHQEPCSQNIDLTTFWELRSTQNLRTKILAKLCDWTLNMGAIQRKDFEPDDCEWVWIYLHSNSRPLSAETNGNVMYYLTLLPTRNANIKLAITTLRKRLDYIYRDFYSIQCGHSKITGRCLNWYQVDLELESAVEFVTLSA